MESNINRRQFIGTTAAASVSLGLTNVFGANDSAAAASKPATLGGKKAHPGQWPKWPVFDQTEEKALLETLRTGEWFRYYKGAEQVAKFEEVYAARAGAKYCVATSSGTSSLYPGFPIFALQDNVIVLGWSRMNKGFHQC